MKKILIMICGKLLFAYIVVHAMHDGSSYREGSTDSSSSTERTQEGYLNQILGSDLEETLDSGSPFSSPLLVQREQEDVSPETTPRLPAAETATLLPTTMNKNSDQKEATKKQCACWLSCCLCCTSKKRADSGDENSYKPIEK